MKTIIITIAVIIIAFLGYQYFTSTPDVIKEGTISENHLSSGTHCFHYELDTPSLVDVRTLAITIAGESVTGEKRGRNQTPEYHTSYLGTLTGSLDEQGTINTSYSYEIEGDKQVRVERYVLEGNVLTEFGYPYIEDFDASILRVDESVGDNGQGQTFPMLTQYTKVSCEQSSL